MGLSTYIVAFVSPEDQTYKNHANVLKACHDAGVSLPKETAEYFGQEEPEKYLLDEKLEIEIPFTQWDCDDQKGYQILVKDIPEGVHKIRFYNSW